MARACLAAGLVAAGLSAPALDTASAPVAAAASSATGAILFQDDFTGASGAFPDRSKWQDYSSCTYNSTAAFGAITCGDNEHLDGKGHLVVPATPKAGSGLRTGDRFGFVYGTMSAWIKIPPQAGYWPAFWSLNSRVDGLTTPTVGEADAMEAYTTWLATSHAGGHSYSNTGKNYGSVDNYCASRPMGNLSTAYHKYSARIEPGKITFFVDDVQCGGTYVKKTSLPWGFGPDVTRPNWLLLDLAVGGAGGQQKTPTANAVMLVDRVEVRGLPNGNPPGTPTPPPPPVIISGATYRLVNACGGMVLSVAPPGTATGAPLQTSAYTGKASQRWQVVETDSGYTKLLNVGSGQSVNVASRSTSNGATVVQYPYQSETNAQWRITVAANGTGNVVARHSGKALDVRGGSAAAGAAVDQATPASGCAQTWQFVRS